MESAVATPEAPPEEPQAAHDGVAEATRSTEELFQWSGYVHVGAGAEECEHAKDGQCREHAHFHAWVCLPNQFQIRDIADKARAAKARKSRALRDPESDSHAVLEDELEDVRRDHYDELIEALAAGEVEKRIIDIMRGVDEDKRFEHHAQDAEEFQRLDALPEEERDAEEYERLQADMLAYAEATKNALATEQEAERVRLRQMTPDEVIELERRARTETITTEAYLHTYYTWAMYVCARRPATKGFPVERIFRDPGDLKNAPPEVVVALRQKIRDLEQRPLRADAGRSVPRGDDAGNS